MSYTPGPWKLETVKTSVGVCHKIGEFPRGVANPSRPFTYGCVYEDGTSNWRLLENGTLDSELLANARLMAAAPDLLEALKELLDALVDCDGSSSQLRLAVRMAGGADLLTLADTAIAKAEG